MYYSSGNYEAFARPEKPEGVDHKSAYLIGSGLAALLLPVLVTGPGGVGTQHQHQHPGDQVAVLLPEVLELLQLFLLFVVVGRHVCRSEGL